MGCLKTNILVGIYLPTGMVTISAMQIIFYIIDMIKYDTIQAIGPMTIVLMYNSHKRYEAWRYVTYMLVHVKFWHLCVNLLGQILLAIPLEKAHGCKRVLLIYFAGVIAGSLGTSLTNPTESLAGASGGVYSLLTANIASVIMRDLLQCTVPPPVMGNWQNWKKNVVQIGWLLICSLATLADFGYVIYNRYFLNLKDNISFEAHVAGAVAGLLVGIFILRNLEVNSCEKKLWWVSLVVYLALMTMAVCWNAFYTDYFPKQL